MNILEAPYYILYGQFLEYKEAIKLSIISKQYKQLRQFFLDEVCCYYRKELKQITSLQNEACRVFLGEPGECINIDEMTRRLNSRRSAIMDMISLIKRSRCYADKDKLKSNSNYFNELINVYIRHECHLNEHHKPEINLTNELSKLDNHMGEIVRYFGYKV